MVPPPAITVMLPQRFPWASAAPAIISEVGDTTQATNNSGMTLTSGSNQETTTGAGHEDDQESFEELDDKISLLNDEEAKDLNSPLVEENLWKPPAPILRFLEKHFNPEKNLDAPERQAIMDDFPMPECDAIQVPKLDPEVKNQLRKKGRNPQFGMEQCLF